MPDTNTPTPAPRLRPHRGRWAAGMFLLLLPLFIALWLLGTGNGRDLILNQISARLPEGTILTWSRAEGVLLGNVTLRNVRYSQALEQGPLDVSAQQLTLHVALAALLHGQIHLKSLHLDSATLDLPPPATTHFTLPEWQTLWPEIDLPLTLSAHAIALNHFSIRQHGESLIDIRRLRGAVLVRAGELRVTALRLDSDRGRFWLDGVYRPARNQHTWLTASARLPGSARARFGLAVRGDRDALSIALAGFTPEPVKAQWTWQGHGWTLEAESSAFNPGVFTERTLTPVAFTLNASGMQADSRWQGQFRQGNLSATLHPATLKVDGQRLALGGFDVEISNAGRANARILGHGHADFSTGSSPQFALNLRTRNAALSVAPAITLDATLDLGGQFARWRAQGQARVTRSGEHATVELNGQGDARRVQLHKVNAHTPSGDLAASGSVTWAPALGWDVQGVLDGFDPGYFFPDWPGTLRGNISSRAHTSARNTLHLALELADIRGQLRQQPLAASVHARAALPARGAVQSEAALALSLGSSQLNVALNAAEQIHLDARLTPLNLADLLPEASGRIEGRLHLSGTRNAPDIEADLNASALSYGNWRASRLRLQGRLPWAQGQGRVQMDASGIGAEDNPAGEFQHIHLRADGTLERLHLNSEIRSALGTLTFDAHSNWQARTWRASIRTLQLTPAQGPAWQLQSPLDVTRQRTRRAPQWTLGHACLSAPDSGTICVRADWPGDGLELSAKTLPLSLFAPLLAGEILDTPALSGELNLNAALRPLARGWQGEVRLRSQQGRLSSANSEVLGYRDLHFDLDLTGADFRARFSAALPAPAGQTEVGQLEATLTGGWEDQAPFSGQLRVDMSSLTWLELFSGDLAAPGGRLSARLHLGGTRSAPTFSGRADLTELSAELPALGLRLDAGEFHLTAASDAPARVYGQLRSGDGLLRADGHLDWHQPGVPFSLNLRGENLLAANTRDLKLTITPDLRIETAARQPLHITGRVDVPSALLELERLHSGESVSSDVVVLDPAAPDAATGRSTLHLDVTLALGSQVRLRGFGLDGRLAGDLRVNADPGHEMTASGRLDVSGGYKAYGQALTITRGQLQFTNGPLDDPLVTMTAERKIETEDMTAGMTVTGRASAPEVSVWTNPATDNSQALSWLAFGRSMASLTKLESQQFDTAAAALTAGGNLLAGQIGRKIGLDDAGVSTSRTLGESVLGIGKQISPRLYVGVGVSMIGSGQVMTLKYLLRKGFDVEFESSTVESRGSVNWRHESD